MSDKIKAHHLQRKAVLYIRQSTAFQVLHNQESGRLQYGMETRLEQLGWREIEVIDERCQAHHIAAPELRFLRNANEPHAIKSAGGTLIGRVELNAQLQRFVAQETFREAQIHRPHLLIARRHNLKAGFELFADLFANFSNVRLRYWRSRQALM